jgi:hypothetical protein
MLLFYALAAWHLAQAAFWLRLANLQRVSPQANFASRAAGERENESVSANREQPVSEAAADHETGVRTRQAIEELGR